MFNVYILSFIFNSLMRNAKKERIQKLGYKTGYLFSQI